MSLNQAAYFDFTVKPVLSSHSKEDQRLVFKTNYYSMHVRNIAKGIRMYGGKGVVISSLMIFYFLLTFVVFSNHNGIKIWSWERCTDCTFSLKALFCNTTFAVMYVNMLFLVCHVHDLRE